MGFHRTAEARGSVAGRRKCGVQGRVALGGLGVDAVADSGATAWGGGHGSSAAGIYGASSWRAGTGARAHAVAAHARAAARRRTGRGGRMPWRRMHGWRCAGGGGRKRRGGAQAAGGGVGTESEGKGEEREEEEARFGCEFNSCDWLHEFQTLEDWREKKFSEDI